MRHADAGAYFHGVARNVLRELAAAAPGAPARPPGRPRWRPTKRSASAGSCASTPAWTRCPPEERQLILWYYQSGERVHIEARRGLAGALGIGMNALRIRAHRIPCPPGSLRRARLAAQIESVPEPRLGENTGDSSDDEARRRSVTALPERAECRCAQVPPSSSHWHTGALAEGADVGRRGGARGAQKGDRKPPMGGWRVKHLPLLTSPLPERSKPPACRRARRYIRPRVCAVP